MTAKKKGNTAAKLKTLLTTGSLDDSGEKVEEMTNGGEITIDDVVETPAEVAPVQETAPAPPVKETPIEEKTNDIPEVQAPAAAAAGGLDANMLNAAIKAACDQYMTSKEVHKSYMDAVEKRDAEMADKKLMTLLTQMCAMREDFFKLCSDMEKKIDKFSPGEVLDSFKAYSTDLENMLVDSGVVIGKSEFNKLNTIHQRLVDVVPTDDNGLNGTIAERMTEGYTYRGKVLVKEKVKVYKYTEKNDNNKGV